MYVKRWDYIQAFSRTVLLFLGMMREPYCYNILILEIMLCKNLNFLDEITILFLYFCQSASKSEGLSVTTMSFQLMQYDFPSPVTTEFKYTE